MNPEVSVIVPTYNSQGYIAKALESVFKQTHQNLEIILVDDASTDSTVSIAGSFKDKRLKIFTNSRNRGVSYSRNRGIRQAKGEWIALLDSDDWYAPDRIEQLLIAARKNSADLIADDLFFVYDNQDRHWGTLLQENCLKSSSSYQLIDAVKFVTSDRPSAIGAKRNWSLGYVKPLIKKEFLRKNNIWYKEDINVGEDFTLYLECLWHHAKFCLLDRPYYYYRTRETSLSTRKPLDYLSQSCQITQSFINRQARDAADLNIQRVLHQNLAIFRQRITYYRLIESIQKKKISRAIELIFTTPLVLVDILRRFYAAFFSKLSSVSKIKRKNRLSVNVIPFENQSRFETISYSRKIYNGSQAEDV